MPVNSTHPDYDRFSPKWQRARDVAAGQDEIRKNAKLYLPRLKDQVDEDYKAYAERAVFFNAAYRVISAMLGMLFRKAPTVSVPASVQEDFDNINLQGDTFDVFANKTTYELCAVGRAGILVDYTRKPVEDNELTIARAKEIGLRATLQLYSTESIINWRTSKRNGAILLSLVVLKEYSAVTDPQDRFKQKEVELYRVLELDEGGNYIVSVWSHDETGDKIVEEPFSPLMNGKPLTEIPFYIVGPAGIQIEPEEPPLIDLFDLNIAHWRVSADYEHGCHLTGLPTPWISGYRAQATEDGKEPKALYIGSQSAWVFSDPNAKAEFLEFKGEGLKSLERNLDRKEQQMAIIGARTIAAEKKVAETATTAQIHRTGEDSILASIAIAVSTVFQTALTTFANWSGASGEVEFAINRDFLPATLDAPFVLAIVQAFMKGTIPFEAMFALFQRADLIDNEMTVEQALAAIKKEAALREAVQPPAAPAGNGSAAPTQS